MFDRRKFNAGLLKVFGLGAAVIPNISANGTTFETVTDPDPAPPVGERRRAEHGIGNDLLAVDTIAAPFVSLLNPAAGAAMNTIAQLVIKAEVTIQGEKKGATKKQMVFDEFTALLPMVEAALKQQAGLDITIDSTAVSQLIDITVARMNALQAFEQQGIKIKKAS